MFVCVCCACMKRLSLSQRQGYLNNFNKKKSEITRNYLQVQVYIGNLIAVVGESFSQEFIILRNFTFVIIVVNILFLFIQILKISIFFSVRIFIYTKLFILVEDSANLESNDIQIIVLNLYGYCRTNVPVENKIKIKMSKTN